MGVVAGTILDGLNRKQRAIIHRCTIKALNKKRNCLNKNCVKKVKKHSNHLLQVRGILGNIAGTERKNWRYEHDFFSSSNSIKFERKGIYDSFKFNGFCGECDDILFKDIEKNKYIEKKETDFTQPEVALLFSFRPYIWEMRKQEIRLDISRCLEKTTLINELRDHIKIVDEESEAKFKFFKNYFDVFFNSEKQKPKIRLIPKLEAACSSIPSQSLLSEETGMIYPYMYLFNLIPLHDKTVVIISTDCENAQNTKPTDVLMEGFIPRELYNNFDSLSEHEIKKYISDILIRYSEDWVISDELYKSCIEPRKSKVIRELEKGITTDYKYSQYWDDPTFNLFDPET